VRPEYTAGMLQPHYTALFRGDASEELDTRCLTGGQ
jgi:hypothetical protein